ncbi:MAG: hypothetical protein KKA90_03195 [Nanoarchaeota archaeon]|nr:hypothetical protein [Nanoarchaeota archaeon]
MENFPTAASFNTKKSTNPLIVINHDDIVFNTGIPSDSLSLTLSPNFGSPPLDPDLITDVTFIIDNYIQQDDEYQLYPEGNDIIIVFDYILEPLLYLGDGSHILGAQIDFADGSSVSTTKTITLDITTPELAVEYEGNNIFSLQINDVRPPAEISVFTGNLYTGELSDIEVTITPTGSGYTITLPELPDNMKPVVLVSDGGNLAFAVLNEEGDMTWEELRNLLWKRSFAFYQYVEEATEVPLGPPISASSSCMPLEIGPVKVFWHGSNLGDVYGEDAFKTIIPQGFAKSFDILRNAVTEGKFIPPPMIAPTADQFEIINPAVSNPAGFLLTDKGEIWYVGTVPSNVKKIGAYERYLKRNNPQKIPVIVVDKIYFGNDARGTPLFATSLYNRQEGVLVLAYKQFIEFWNNRWHFNEDKLTATLQHELIHSYGIQHSNDKNNMMFWASTGGTKINEMTKLVISGHGCSVGLLPGYLGVYRDVYSKIGNICGDRYLSLGADDKGRPISKEETETHFATSFEPQEATIVWPWEEPCLCSYCPVWRYYDVDVNGNIVGDEKKYSIPWPLPTYNFDSAEEWWDSIDAIYDQQEAQGQYPVVEFSIPPDMINVCTCMTLCEVLTTYFQGNPLTALCEEGVEPHKEVFDEFRKQREELHLVSCVGNDQDGDGLSDDPDYPKHTGEANWRCVKEDACKTLGPTYECDTSQCVCKKNAGVVVGTPPEETIK